MTRLPEKVIKAWDDRNGPIIFTTVNDQGMPNTIYATCVSIFNESTIVVADNFFDKTRKNILSGCKGTILFITNEGTSYQIKGRIKYYKEGEIFEDMKKWNPPEHPGHAAVAMEVEEIYTGAERLL